MAIFWVVCLGVLIPLFYSFCLISLGEPRYISNLIIFGVLAWACSFALYHTLKVEE